jgi:hypothetical protein
VLLLYIETRRRGAVFAPRLEACESAA